MDLRIPGSLKTEHEGLYEELNKAARVTGGIGEAAMSAFKIFQHHRTREEEFAFPPLHLLRSLAEKSVDTEFTGVIKLCDKLKGQMSTLVKEHDEMRKSLHEMNDIAMKEQKPEYASLAKRLLQHMSMEEEIYYPASLVVGEYIKEKLYGAPSLPLPR